MSDVMRVLALVTDGFGGHGGIARYNDAFLRALAALDMVELVTVLPRYGEMIDDVPARIRQLPPARSKVRYLTRLSILLSRQRDFDLVFCGHINMALIATVIARLIGCPSWLQLHGIEAWSRPGWWLRGAAERADLVTAVSRHTRRRFLSWVAIDPCRVRVLPDTVEPRFTPGPKPQHLLRRYGLEGRRTLLTVARLAASERYKGQDRVIDLLPKLRESFPDIVYVIVGDGDDRPRIEAHARETGVADMVRFLGRVAEADLVAHYRMADVFVMPSTGEGFGIVFLEAMACGIQAIGLDADGSVDPLSVPELGLATSIAGLRGAIEAALIATPGQSGMLEVENRFSNASFRQGLETLAEPLLARAA